VRTRLSFVIFLFLLPAAALARGDREFDVRPAPAWVERLPVDTAFEVPRVDARFGMYALLSDHQVRVRDGSTTEYFRRIRKVVSSSGVQHASELSFDFDPSYQHLVLHDVALLRGTARIEELQPDEVRIIEKEADSDDKIFDGVLTAIVFLKDVRPGDVIEYSWSLEGSNSLLGGKYADDFDLSSSLPTQRLRHRLLFPAKRPLHYRSTLASFEPRATQHGDEKELVWERKNVTAIETEDGTPDWFDPFESVQVSEFESWHEVGQWAMALFQLDPGSTTAVKALADRIRNEHPNQQERVLAAIRFVQDDIRYLGIEMGRNSHEPHQPSVTLAQRWGDCKDKAFLLAALLRELGVEAYPALVNTKLRHELDRQLPSPFLFDHVITQVNAGSKTRWIDATLADQGGTLDTIETPDDERALVVRPETSALTKIVTLQQGSVLVEQTYTATDYTSPVKLEVRSTHSGHDADDMRAWLASRSLSDVAKEHLNRYAADQPKIRAAGLPKINDDRVKNVIVIRESYAIQDLWKDEAWTYYPRAIERHLHRPETMIRSMPLDFPYPLSVTQKMVFHLPETLDIESETHVVESPAFRYESSVAIDGHTLTVTHQLHALRDSLTAAQIPDHLAKLNEVWSQLGFTFGPGTSLTAAGDVRRNFQALPGWAWGAFLGVVLIVSFLRLARARRLENRKPAAIVRSPAERVSHSRFRPGEAAESAIPLRTSADMPAMLATLPCLCGAAVNAPVDLQQARYGDGHLTIATRLCERCGREQSVYFSQLGGGLAIVK
jgi:transglutaminase-like putative cysteine protease